MFWWGEEKNGFCSVHRFFSVSGLFFVLLPRFAFDILGDATMYVFYFKIYIKIAPLARFFFFFFRLLKIFIFDLISAFFLIFPLFSVNFHPLTLIRPPKNAR
jgi:hypothetical protein